jgi:hypothetical protein
MTSDRVLFGPAIETCMRDARRLRAQYLSDCARAARHSRTTRRAAAGLGVGVVAFLGLASFAPSHSSQPDLPSFSPSELSAGLKNVPEAERWDAH